MMLESVVYSIRKPVEFLVIWLHGLGADGYDFMPVAEQLEPHLHANVAFVFPHANELAVTINGGMKMRAWYDILSMDLSREVNVQHIHESREALNALVDAKMQEYDIQSHSQVILAGFSQGGVIALDEFFANGETKSYAGIMALSTYHHDLESVTSLNKKTSIFLAHGSADPVVPIELAEDVKSTLEKHQANYSWHAYSMGHSVVPDQIRDILDWLNSVAVNKES